MTGQDTGSRADPPVALAYASARGKWVLTATVLGSGLAMLDGTVVNVALPRIGEDLGGGLTALQWTLNAYTLTLSGLLLLGGSLGDRMGRRRVYIVGVLWFTLTSVGCALAPSTGALIAMRALQGAGAALLTPGSLAILQASFRREDRSTAVGAWSGLGGVATALGPIIGGVLVGLAPWGWRLVFLINVPIAVVVIVLARRYVPESRDEQATGRLDVPGAVLASVGLVGLVYGLTEGISQKTLRAHVAQAVVGAVDQVEEWLPEEVRTRLGAGEDGPLPTLSAALREIHLPSSLPELERAQRRLAFDQLLLLQVGQVRRKQERQAHGGIPLRVDRALLGRFRASLPYTLTGAQDRALGEILADLEAERPMSRLLQGDVGAGKTVVAAAAMVVARANGRQSAMMAPTEILAEQHFHNLRGLFSGLPDEDRPTVALLTGSTKAKARRETLAAAAAGEVDVLVGTHALIQEGVALPRLGFSVVDEQHRFGVRQRATLPVQGEGDDVLPHQLSMTATPIPRTLNMVLNGDLDVSIVDELPPGREPIETQRFVGSQREEAYALVREQVRAGRQVFVICPLVEASEAIEAKAAVEEAERLRREVFPDLRIATLHGRMSGRAKEAVMTAFRDREHDILVSTSVVEVGVDVPNATVMLIEGADRFGLAQLHQFRGRVGRGGGKSWCLLLADETTPDADARLEMMAQTNDGFLLAEKDLELRGPGDFLGTRQSGLPELTWIDGGFDPRLLDRARRVAEALLDADPDLEQPEHQRLRDRVEAFWAKASPDLPIVG